MNRMLLVCGVAALLAAGCTAYPTGAPASVCNDPLMRPTSHIDHYGATGVNNTNEYTLTSEPVADKPGVYKVTLSGPVFKGFVVRATTPNEKNNGNFITDPEATDFSIMACASQEDVAVTHVSSKAKFSVTLFWQDGNKGNYRLQATVVSELSNYVTSIFAL